MKRTVTISLSIFFFLISIVLLVFHKQWFLVPQSPQATVNPNTLQEKFSPHETVAFFDNKPLQIPQTLNRLLAQKPTTTKVLGETSGAKRIEVDLTNQRLYAYEGDQMIYNFLVSTGKWGKTPTGVFDIWIKLRSTKMSGGKKELGTYYYLPNVPYTMYFYNADTPKWRGFGVHGAYWHNNFGHPMSHGCINMKIEEAGLLFEWAKPETGGKGTTYASEDNPGTQIVIYGEAPNG